MHLIEQGLMFGKCLAKLEIAELSVSKRIVQLQHIVNECKTISEKIKVLYVDIENIVTNIQEPKQKSLLDEKKKELFKLDTECYIVTHKIWYMKTEDLF